jgi:hypothetical protein
VVRGFIGGQGQRPATWTSRRAVDHARREKNGDDDLLLCGVIPKRYALAGLGRFAGGCSQVSFLLFSVNLNSNLLAGF